MHRDSLMTAPRTVMQLVRKFGEHREICTAGVPGETHPRMEFIDPLFRALGWDVDNSKGRSPLAYREVVREDTALAEGGKRAPDYSFRIDGQRKFFVDTRKPTAGIGADPGPTVQLRRYAWSARLLISIVNVTCWSRRSWMASSSSGLPRLAGSRLAGSCRA